MSGLRIEKHHKKRFNPQRKTKIHVQGLRETIRRGPDKQKNQPRNLGTGGQIVARKNTVGRNFEGDRHFGAMDSKLRQQKI